MNKFNTFVTDFEKTQTTNTNQASIMKHTILTLLAAATITINSHAKVDYRVIPMPQSIQIDKSGKHILWTAGNQPKTLTDLRSDNPEAYRIVVDSKGVTIHGATDAGVFYGLQTFLKSIALEEGPQISLPHAVISGAPRFPYRGAHLDVARHYFPADFIYTYIDILALHGLNQFHWHLTDDQGWRFEVKGMPQLALKGQYRPNTVIGKNCGITDDTPEQGYYTQEEMRRIVQYAAERHINIIPEIDLPGHMVAALSVYPGLGCTGGPYSVWNRWGVSPDVLCAGNPDVLPFLKKILAELCDIFPSKIIHIGGDESPRDRWKKCPKCQARIKELGLKDEAALQTYINKELDEYLTSRGRTLMGWDETLEGGLSPNAMVMSWRGIEGGIASARQHHRAVMTPGGWCYFDHYQLRDKDAQPLAIGGYTPLSKIYAYDPMPSQLTPEEQKYIIGVQCNVWTEYIVSPQHVQYMLLPRLAALSEVQWLEPGQKDYEDFKKRLTAMQKIYDKYGYNYCRRYE